MGGGPAVLAADLAKTYHTGWRRRPVPALRGVSFALPAGGVLAVFGPNGSGKSTLLRLLAGLARPTGGHAEVAGALAGSRAARATVGYLPENPGLPAGLTPREVLALHTRLLGMGGETRRRAIADGVGALGLAAVADRPCRTLSTGEARRVGLARALLGTPAVLLLDEPTAGLDPFGVRDLAVLLDARRRAGAALVLASHLDSPVERLADRVLVLRDGAVVREGAAATLLADPHALEVRAAGLPPDAADAIAGTLAARGVAGVTVQPARRAITDLLGPEGPIRG